jgi:hypothetical protein
MGMAFADGKALKAETEKHDAELRVAPAHRPARWTTQPSPTS